MAYRLRRMTTFLVLFSLLGLLIVACGGGGDSGAEQGAATAGATTATEGGAATDVTPDAAPTEEVAVPTEVATEPAMMETATTDAGTEETATMDAGTEETATMDAGTDETATTDAAGAGTDETATAGTDETATADAGTEETATADAGTEETATADAGTSTGTAGGAALTLPAECSNVELQYWNPFTGPDGPFMGEMVDAFNQVDPNIQVVMTSQGEYYTQIGTAAASDTLPDVAIMHVDQVPTHVFRNVVRPIDELVQQIGISESDFPSAVWQGGEVAGKRYSIPLDIHPMTMFYNQDLLTAAGVSSPPTTGEEFTAAAQALTQGDNKGFLITTGFPVAQIFQMLLHQYGGSEFNEDGTEATWNSDAGVQALQWMVDAQRDYSEPNLEVDAELNAFKGGTVGMIWNGIWQTTNVTGEGVDFNGMATAVPQIGPEAAVWAGSHQFTLPVHATVDPCKDAASGIFIKYMLDNSVTWARAGQIPANNTVRASLATEGVEPQASIAPSVEGAFFPPAIPGIGDAFVPMGEAVSAIMSGSATDIKATLDEAAGRANQILADNKANYGDAPSAP